MNESELVPGDWYWLRHENGKLAPFRFHRVTTKAGKRFGEFYVGSMLTTWSLGRVVGRAEMPKK